VSQHRPGDADHVGYEEAGDYDDDVRLGSLRERASPSPFGGPRDPDPCSIVIFGVTGDLAFRKLIPAVYDLACHDVLPSGTPIVGYGRQPMDDAQFCDQLDRAIQGHYGEEAVEAKVCERVLIGSRYVQGQFDDPEGYRRLSGVLDRLDQTGDTRGNRMFYLATPPSQFPVIVRALDEAGLARVGANDAASAKGDPVPGWTRIVVEKPFGHDEAGARELNRIIDTAFDERQVYRIDHYLAKETVQNLLVMRFANGIQEPIWNRRYVDHVQITAAETLGVQHRAPYYEAAGASRDMLGPHLLQLFTLVAMEPPVTLNADDLRDEKLKVLRSVRPIPPGRVDSFAVRGQYVDGIIDGDPVPGYRKEDRVASDSFTETFAAAKLLVDNWRWQGVPFYLRTGKRLARKTTEIVVQFKQPPVTMFRELGPSGSLLPNQLILRVQPDEGFSLRIESKEPGRSSHVEPVLMDYSYGGTLHELPFSAYETLLVDAMEGDMSLFNRRDQVEAAWHIMQPILEAWKTPPRHGIPIYEAGSWGPEASDALIAHDGHSWRKS
jgi:glucose-6-phosphate 1-dehydrogenase